MAVPSKTALHVYRGDAVGLAVSLWKDTAKTEPVDLTGAALDSQVRETQDSTAVIADFLVEVAANVVTMTLLPKQSAALPATSVFDLQVTWDGIGGDQVQTVLVGSISATPDVTRVD